MSLVPELALTLRSLLRRPFVPVLLVLVVGTGVAFLTTSFSVLDAMLWRPLAFGEPSRYVMMGEREQGRGSAPVPRTRADVYATVRQAHGEGKLPSVEAIIPVEEREVSLVVNGIGSEETATWLVPHTTRHRDTVPLLGHVPAGPDGGARAAPGTALGEALWARRFARDPGVLGAPGTFDGEAAVIVGVMPARFQFHRVSEVWVAWPEAERLHDPAREGQLVVKLVEGADWHDVASAATTILGESVA